MKIFIKSMLLACILQLTFSQSHACWPTGDVTWTGETNSNWNIANNYSGNWGALPDNRDRVIIDLNEYDNAPVINDNPEFRPGSIYLQNGAHLTINVTADTEFFEVGGGDNVVAINNGAALTISEDFLLNRNGGEVTVEGNGGQVEIGNDLLFENNGTTLTNNLSGDFDVGNNVIFEVQNSWLENSGTLSITGDLSSSGVSANANRINNNLDAVLNVGGDIDLLGAVTFISNEGTINQSGNFTAINAICLFENKSGGVWNWAYTGNNAADADMVSVLIAGGTVAYNGMGAQNIIPVVYNDLIVEGTGIKQLQGQTTVGGNLNLSGAHLALNDFDLTIESNGDITNNSSSSFLITNGNGKLIQDSIGAGGRTGDIVFPVGASSASYTPVTLNNNSGTIDNFSIKVISGIYEDGYTGTAVTSGAVDKTWFIDEEVAGGSDATLIFQWNDNDHLSEFYQVNSRIIHYNGALWETLSEGAALGAGPYTFAASGVTSFSPFGVESTEGALPVGLLYFKGNLKGDEVVLEWSTASEINNDYFTVEKTVDFKNYRLLGKVEGSGTTGKRRTYHFYDNNLSYGNFYYRLKQTDFNGRFTYSDVVRINHSSSLPAADMTIYPVPNNGRYIKLRLTGIGSDEEIPLFIYNIQGKIVHQQSLIMNDFNEITLSFNEKLPSGVYTLRAKTPKPLSKEFVVR